jgi:hypothetical protein
VELARLQHLRIFERLRARGARKARTDEGSDGEQACDRPTRG